MCCKMCTGPGIISSITIGCVAVSSSGSIGKTSSLGSFLCSSAVTLDTPFTLGVSRTAFSSAWALVSAETPMQGALAGFGDADCLFLPRGPLASSHCAV